MRFSLRLFAIASLVTLASATSRAQTIVNFDFGAVRIDCASDYAYEWPVGHCGTIYPTQSFNSSPGFGWTISKAAGQFFGLAGMTGPNTNFNPPSFDGLPFNQAVFLQGTGSDVQQLVTGFSVGAYVLSFYLGTRSGFEQNGNQTVEALIDGHVIGTWSLQTFTPFTLQSATFTVSTSGSHTVEFRGIHEGDHTAFLSYVTIAPGTR
jgi:hypothetical protein